MAHLIMHFLIFFSVGGQLVGLKANIVKYAMLHFMGGEKKPSIGDMGAKGETYIKLN